GAVVGGQGGGDPLDEGGRWDRVGDDVGDHPLAEVVVGLADHGGLVHRRVGEQRVLHLTGADPVPAALDQVGGRTAEDPVAAGRVHGGDVPGPEPAVRGER